MNTSKMTKMKRVRRQIFHHAGYHFKDYPIIKESAPLAEKLEAAIEIFELVDSWHMERWATGCGYHYVIGNGHGIPDGHINIWRPVHYQGAHTRGQNHDSIGIMLMGNLAVTQPTPAQIEACFYLAKHLCIAHSLNPVGEYDEKRYGKRNQGYVISGHKDWRGHESNDCPGSLHDYLPTIRKTVEEMLILEAPISTVYYKGKLKKKERNK